MKNNLVSIIIPAYNCGRYIEDCLDSVLSQTYSEIEVIAVDDGSEDNTLSILEEAAKEDNRLKVYSRVHEGAGSARNFALHIAKGEFLMFVDADDMISENAVQKLCEILTSTGADMVKSHYYRFDGKGGIKKSIFKSRWPEKTEIDSREALRLMLCERFSSSACGKIYRRQIIGDATIFGNGMTFNEDFHFLWLLYHKKIRIILYPEETYAYRQHEESVTAGFDPRHLELLPYLDSLNAQDSDEKKWLKSYKDARIAHIVFTMMRTGAQRPYREAYRSLCGYLRKHFFRIIFNKAINPHNRIKTIIGALQGW